MRLKEFILAHGLQVHNVEGMLPTYRGNFDERRNFEETNIDVTVSKGNAIEITNWEVLDDGCSDHRLISFNLDIRLHAGNILGHLMISGRWLLRKANWGLYFRKLRSKLGVWETTIEESTDEVLAEAFGRCIVDAANEATPHSAGRDKVSYWWSRE